MTEKSIFQLNRIIINFDHFQIRVGLTHAQIRGHSLGGMSIILKNDKRRQGTTPAFLGARTNSFLALYNTNLNSIRESARYSVVFMVTLVIAVMGSCLGWKSVRYISCRVQPDGLAGLVKREDPRRWFFSTTNKLISPISIVITCISQSHNFYSFNFCKLIK